MFVVICIDEAGDEAPYAYGPFADIEEATAAKPKSSGSEQWLVQELWGETELATEKAIREGY